MAEKDVYINWLREALRTSGVSQAELGRRINLKKDQVNRLLAGTRTWTDSTVDGIAKALRVSRPDMPEIHLLADAVGHAEVVGMINPNVWTDGDYICRHDVLVPFVPDPRYAGLKQSAYLAEVDIPGTQIQAGAYVITVPFGSMREAPLNGDTIVCTRRRDTLRSNVIGIGRISNNGITVVATPSVDIGSDEIIPEALVIGVYLPIA